MTSGTVAVSVGVLVLGFCVITAGQLVIFLSSHSVLKYNREVFHDVGRNGNFWKPLIINIFLLGVFITQHTLQAKLKVKNYLARKGLDVIDRLLYNAGACLSLQLIMRFWQPVNSWFIWNYSNSDSNFLWWLFSIVHGLAWLEVYSGCLIMDLTELLGIKQVYYFIQGWPEPLCQKSEDLRCFYSHMRHPSFLALVLILFVHPVMQIDRLFLAYALTIYMILAFRTDERDYAYHRRMLWRKERDLTIT